MNGDKVELGRITIPEDKKSWMKHVTSDGRVMATPPGGRKYTDAERKTVDEAVKKVTASFVARGKSLREAESKALREFKKDPLSDKLKTAYLKAKDARVEFDTNRKPAENKAKREAREKVLK